MRKLASSSTLQLPFCIFILFSEYKPYVISRDEEPVKIKNASGEMIPIHHVFKLEPGKIRWKVLFDTGNEVGTGISRELLKELKLEADPKKKEVELIGGESREFETTQIELVVRGHHFSVCGLVDAVLLILIFLWEWMSFSSCMIKGIILVTNLWYILRISKMMNALCSKLPVNMKVVYRCICVPDHFAERGFFNFFCKVYFCLYVTI